MTKTPVDKAPVDRSEARDDCLQALARLETAIRASGDVVYEWDLATDEIVFRGDITSLFDAEGKTMPRSGEEMQARINPEDVPRRRRALSDHFAGTCDYDCEFRLRTRQGEFQWLHDRGAVEYSPAGTPARMSGVIRLVTLRKQQEERLEYLANFDDLTGHFNKVRLREALEHALAQSMRFGQSGVYMVIGVDHLDRINTGYGYETGNAVLVELGRRLDNYLRAADVIGRPGGDFFGAILSACSEDTAQIAAERVLQSMRDNPITVGADHVHVTVSIGAVVFPAESKTAVDAMTKAESAMQQAKAAGRDCLRFFALSEEQRQGYRASMDIGEEVQLALKEDRIVLAHQPVVDAGSHKVTYYECLVRMYDREGKVVPAAQFVPAIEQLVQQDGVPDQVVRRPCRGAGRHGQGTVRRARRRLQQRRHAGGHGDGRGGLPGGLARHPGDQPHRRLPGGQVSGPGDDRARRRLADLHFHLRRPQRRHARYGRLRGQQGGAGRADPGAGGGARGAGHPC